MVLSSSTVRVRSAAEYSAPKRLRITLGYAITANERGTQNTRLSLIALQAPIFLPSFIPLKIGKAMPMNDEYMLAMMDNIANKMKYNPASNAPKAPKTTITPNCMPKLCMGSSSLSRLEEILYCFLHATVLSCHGP